MMKKNISTILTMCFIISSLEVFGQTTIQMQKEGGVFTVPCKVNGISLRFIFDTGASDVSISLTEALFMFKNGLLNSSDIIGSEVYQSATGDLSVGTKILLREIEFSGLILYNVEASIVHELSAPLLLGQSAMSKLGKFQFDPNSGMLTILNESYNQVNIEIQNYLKLWEMNPTRTDVFDKISKYYRETKDYRKVIEIYKLKKEKTGKLGTNDYFYIGQANFHIKNYIIADSAFAKYCELFPNLTGYYWRAKVARAIDVDDSELKANPYYEKVIEYGEKDREKYKQYLTEAYYYIAYGYYAQKNYGSAKIYLNKTMELDPTHTLANDLFKHISSEGR